MRRCSARPCLSHALHEIAASSPSPSAGKGTCEARFVSRRDTICLNKITGAKPSNHDSAAPMGGSSRTDERIAFLDRKRHLPKATRKLNGNRKYNQTAWAMIRGGKRWRL